MERWAYLHEHQMDVYTAVARVAGGLIVRVVDLVQRETEGQCAARGSSTRNVQHQQSGVT